MADPERRQEAGRLNDGLVPETKVVTTSRTAVSAVLPAKPSDSLADTERDDKEGYELDLNRGMGPF